MDSQRRKEIEERVETVRGRFYDEHSDTSYLLTVWAELTRMEQALELADNIIECVAKHACPTCQPAFAEWEALTRAKGEQ